MVVAVSLLIISLTVGQFELCISSIAGVSNLLLVTILAAHRTTVPKFGSTIPRYILLNAFEVKIFWHISKMTLLEKLWCGEY